MWQEDCLTFVPCTLILPHMIRAPKSKLCDYPHPPDLSSRLMYSAVNTEAKGNVLGTSLATREAGLLQQELINKVTLKASQHGVLEDSTLKERIQLDSRPRLNDECFTISGSYRCFSFSGIRLTHASLDRRPLKKGIMVKNVWTTTPHWLVTHFCKIDMIRKTCFFVKLNFFQIFKELV